MITNYVYLFAVVLLFLIIVIKAMDELVYQRKIKKIIGIIISKTLQLDKDHAISFYDFYQARSF